MGRKKRLHKKIRSWWEGYVDFSEVHVEGYHYIKSTYRKDLASSLIKEENIQLIKHLISVYKRKERWYYKLIRFAFERRRKENSFEESFLYRIYCNGFTSGYKNVDQKLKVSTKNLHMLSIDECKAAIKMYVKELDDINDSPNEQTKSSFEFIDFLVDIGIREGANVRGLLYEKELQELNLLQDNTLGDESKKNIGRPKKGKKLSELFTIKVVSERLVTEYILDYISKNNTGKDLAYLRIALEELYYTNRMEHEEYYRALCLEFTEEKIQIKSDTIRNNYNSLLRKDKDEAFMARDLPFHRKKIDDIKEQLIKLNSINSEN